jgi:hypothetical protein
MMNTNLHTLSLTPNAARLPNVWGEQLPTNASAVAAGLTTRQMVVDPTPASWANAKAAITGIGGLVCYTDDVSVPHVVFLLAQDVGLPLA